MLIKDHEITLYYIRRNNRVFATNKSDNTRIAATNALVNDGFQYLVDKGSLPTPAWMPPNIRSSLSDGESFWVQCEDNKASSDLYTATRNLIKAKDADPRVTRFTLNRTTKKATRLSQLMLGNGKSPHDYSIVWQPSKSAQGRVMKGSSEKALNGIRLKIDDVSLWSFVTGVTILELRIKMAPIDFSLNASYLLKCIHAVSRKNALTWQNDEQTSQTFSLGQLARSLMEGPNSTSYVHWRVFTATFANVEGANNQRELEELAIRAAKHYHSDYEMGPASKVEVEITGSFDDKSRAASPEGCAIIQSHDDTNFIKNYRKNIWQQSYAPLAVLALHEQEAWTNLVSKSARWHDLDNITPQTIKALADIRRDALQIRMAFTTPRVSRIADHDAWKDSLDAQMRIPKLRTAVAEDLAATEAIIREDAERKRQKRFSWLSAVAGSAAAGFMMFSVVAMLFQMFPNNTWVWDPSPDWKTLSGPEIIIPLFTFLCGFSVAYWRLHRKYDRD